MTLHLMQMVSERQDDKFNLHSQYLNAQFVNVLKMIGFDCHFVRGKGQYLYDKDQNKYLDLLSGFGVFAVGRNHPTVCDALTQVIQGDLPNLVQMDVSVLSGVLAEKLLPYLPGMEKVLFCNSGTEAVEAAIKFSRAATGKNKIISCSHAFHGLTCGALSLNGDDIFKQGFGSLLPDCVSIPFNDLGALEAALRGGDVAAFVVEPIQGKGVHLPDDDYLPDAARLCKKYGALFVADEIQTGIGRTGKFLALEHWGVEPDMILLAKALSGGFVPVGAVATKKWIFEKVFNRMDRAVVHGSTFGKNDLAMAAGIAVLSVLQEEKLVERAATYGSRILDDLKSLVPRYEFLKEVRGKGMMIGVEFGPPKSFVLKASWDMLEKANRGLFCQMVTIPLFRRHHIITQVAGHGMYVVKLLPPLVVSDADCDWIRDSFESAIADCHKIPGSVWDLARSLAGAAVKIGMGR
ncbi:Aminotransferase class III-fold pyridoxal phosphate-dependent enzyme [Azospirillaceae bacterium]